MRSQNLRNYTLFLIHMRITPSSKSDIPALLRQTITPTDSAGNANPLRTEPRESTSAYSFRQKRSSDSSIVTAAKLLLSLSFLTFLSFTVSLADDDEPMIILKKKPEITDNTQPVENKELPLADKTARNKKELDALVATSGKCIEDRDCVALPIGEKPCG